MNRQRDLLAPPKASALEALRLEMLIDRSIVESDLARSATQLVWGDGSPEARILFVGEAPGATEDKSGRPFVGRAGQLLERCLKLIGLQRSQDVWITNLVKHRPPANRDPLPAEKVLYAPYLDREISIIEPLLIIPLGRHAACHFLPNCSLGQDHGRIQHLKRRLGDKLSDLTLVPFYHPAAAIYNQRLLPTLEADFIALKPYLK